MSEEQRDEAVRLVADGVSYSKVAALFAKDKRTIERLFAPGAPLRVEVDRLLRQREQDEHYNADRRWQRNDRQGYREAHDPGMRPEVAERHTPSAIEAEMAQARERILAQQTRQAALAPASDERVIEWVLYEAPRYTTQAEFLDYRDAERGRVSDHARRRYEGRLRTPQVRVFTIPSIAEQAGWRA